MGTLSFPNNFVAGTPAMASQVNANFTAAETWSTTISDDNFSSAAGMYTAYRNILTVNSTLGLDQAAGTYSLRDADLLVATGINIGTAPPAGVYIDDADFAISGRTIRLRLRVQFASNATAPGINFTFGLYPVSVAGIADTVAYTLGTVVSGSTVTLNTPSASTVTSGVGSDFAVPTDGLYVLGVVTSGTQANNNAAGIHAQLQRRWT
jgi:hypothetical protein